MTNKQVAKKKSNLCILGLVILIAVFGIAILFLLTKKEKLTH